MTVEEPQAVSCLDIYFGEIRKIPTIDRGREVRLAREIRAGDQAALDELVRANLRFVVSLSKQYRNLGVPLPDLINEGNIGLIRAARTFDETRGIRFASYAAWWIRQALRQALADQGRAFRVPLKRAEAVHRLTRRRSELAAVLGREPRASELAEDLGRPLHEVERDLGVALEHLSLDDPIFPTWKASLRDCLPAPPDPHPEADQADMEHADRERAAAVESVLNALDPRAATVLRMSFGLDGDRRATLHEIGRALGVSAERARQIREKALARLRLALGQ